MKNFIRRASRSRGFLIKFAVGALVLGTIIGVALSRVQASASHLFGERVLARAGLAVSSSERDFTPSEKTAPRLLDALTVELKESSPRLLDVIWAMPELAPHVAVADRENIRRTLSTCFSADEATLATDLLAASDRDEQEAYAQLKVRAEASEPPRYANYVVGLVEMDRKNYRAAYEHFSREAQRADSPESRYMAVQALAEAKDYASLSALQKDARFAPYFTPRVAFKAATGQRDWWRMLRLIPAVQLHSYRQGVVLLTVIAAFAWALFLSQLGEVRSLTSGTAVLCLCGFLLGVISTTPTVFLVALQDDVLGFSAGDDAYHAVAYYLAGVGAREELCKLLLFLPLLPFLIRRDDELEAFIVAAFVGLGFAIEENGSYFMLSAGASAPGRFLTANFFHVALTGLNGLTLFRACTRGMSGLNDLMLVLPLTITAHGIYDALLDLPGVEGSGFFAMTVYIAFSLYFFGRVHPLRNNTPMTLSLTGAFVIGLSILAGTVIAYQMATLGATAGASLIFSELISSAAPCFSCFCANSTNRSRCSSSQSAFSPTAGSLSEVHGAGPPAAPRRNGSKKIVQLDARFRFDPPA